MFYMVIVGSLAQGIPQGRDTAFSRVFSDLNNIKTKVKIHARYTT